MKASASGYPRVFLSRRLLLFRWHLWLLGLLCFQRTVWTSIVTNRIRLCWSGAEAVSTPMLHICEWPTDTGKRALDNMQFRSQQFLVSKSSQLAVLAVSTSSNHLEQLMFSTTTTPMWWNRSRMQRPICDTCSTPLASRHLLRLHLKPSMRTAVPFAPSGLIRASQKMWQSRPRSRLYLCGQPSTEWSSTRRLHSR